ncbi:MAG: LPS export ABC transporter periplasmic protein LptC [Gemmatimonadota bacterium]
MRTLNRTPGHLRGGSLAGERGPSVVRPSGILIVGLFAMLAACQDKGVTPPVTQTAADSADQILFELSHYVTELGIKRSLVEADTAYMFDATQSSELKKVKVTFYDDNGGVKSTLTANEGTYFQQTGGMTARGNVVGTSPDGRTLRTSELKYDPVAKKISTDKPFTFDRNGDHLEGDGFTSDVDFQNVVVTRPRGVEGGSRLLPGQ